MRGRLGLLLVSIAFVASACGSTPAPTAPVTNDPRSAVVPTQKPAPTATPNAPSTPTATVDDGAEFAITGDGKLACNSPGGCGAALLLQPFDAGPLPASLDFEAPMQFTIDRPTFEHATLLGPVAGAPTRLQVGRWWIGLGQSYSSDVSTCDTPCTSPYYESGTVLLCSDLFDIGEATAKVIVRAHFSPECAIEVLLTTAIVD